MIRAENIEHLWMLVNNYNVRGSYIAALWVYHKYCNMIKLENILKNQLSDGIA